MHEYMYIYTHSHMCIYIGIFVVVYMQYISLHIYIYFCTEMYKLYAHMIHVCNVGVPLHTSLLMGGVCCCGVWVAHVLYDQELEAQLRRAFEVEAASGKEAPC